jgi:hypothetical protein
LEVARGEELTIACVTLRLIVGSGAASSTDSRERLGAVGRIGCRLIHDEDDAKISITEPPQAERLRREHSIRF